MILTLSTREAALALSQSAGWQIGNLKRYQSQCRGQRPEIPLGIPINRYRASQGTIVPGPTS
jgi:hypothetical protein